MYPLSWNTFQIFQSKHTILQSEILRNFMYWKEVPLLRVCSLIFI